MKKRLIFFAFLILFQGIYFCPMALSGNKEHIEKRVEELDHMNKEIVQDVPDIPQYGTIEYKAHVKDGEKDPKVEILEKNIEMGRETKVPKDSPTNNSVTNK